MRLRRLLHAILPVFVTAAAVPLNSTISATATTISPHLAVATASLPPSSTFTAVLATAPGFNNATAKVLASSLPGYTYNLTVESSSTRNSICDQTIANCVAAGCSEANGNATTNFCNPTTLGWNRKCNHGTSLFPGAVVPVNVFDCRLRTAACLDACSDDQTSSTTSNATKTCQTACNYVIGSTCGTSNQALPLYQVSSYSSKPKYYPETSKGGVALGVTTSSSDASFSRSVSTVAVVLAAMVAILGGLEVVR